MKNKIQQHFYEERKKVENVGKGRVMYNGGYLF